MTLKKNIMKNVLVYAAVSAAFIPGKDALAADVSNYNGLKSYIENATTPTTINLKNDITTDYDTNYWRLPHQNGISVSVMNKDITIQGAGKSITLQDGKHALLFDNKGGSTLTINNTSIKNYNFNGYGGALCNTENNTVLNLAGVTFVNNTNTRGDHAGGAIYNEANINIKTGTTTFSNNKSTALNGGAITNAVSASSAGKITADSDSNVIFTSNTAAKNGGAIYNGEGASLALKGTGEFTSNTATSGDGGAIYNGGTADITGTSFTSNTASSGDGGAIYNGGTVNEISNSTFNSNSSKNGGAIYNAKKAIITSITGVDGIDTFKGNTATSDGGAIYNGEGATIGVKSATFTSNSATSDGGAVYNNGTLSIEDSKFNSNTAEKGGAIYNKSKGNISIKSSSFTGNGSNDSKTTTGGGAIYNEGVISEISTSTFSQNKTSSTGGAIENRGTITKIGGDKNSDDSYNTVFSENTSTDGGAIRNEVGATISEINGVEFSQNIAEQDGGAILNNASIGTIKNSKFSSNSAKSVGETVRGGAIANKNKAQSDVTIENTVFDSNTADATGDSAKANNGAQGGAVFNASNHNLTIANSEFTNNSVKSKGSANSEDGNAQGGAIYNSGKDLVVTDTSFSGNSAVSTNGKAQGGAIYNTGNLTLNATNKDITFSQNSASEGSDLYNAGTATINTVKNITFDGTVAGSGTIDKTGAGTWTINGDNSKYTGPVNVNEGKLLVNVADGTEDKYFSTNSTTNVKNGANIEFSVAEGQDFALDSKSSQYISGEGYLVKSGEGTLSLTGDFSGLTGVGQTAGTYINGGILKYTATNGGGDMVGNKISIADGATFNIVNSIATSSFTLDNGVLGTGNFVVNDTNNSGTIILDGENSGLTGLTTVQNGILQYTKSDSNSFVAGAVDIEKAATVDYTNNTTSSGKIEAIIGEGTLNKSGTGELVIGDRISDVQGDFRGDGTTYNNDRFTGNINLNEGSITLNASPQSNDNRGKGQFDFGVNVGNGTTLTYNANWKSGDSNVDDKFTLNGDSKIKFTQDANNAKINFNVGTYTIESDLANANSTDSINISSSTTIINPTADSVTFQPSYLIDQSVVHTTLQNNTLNNITFNKLSMTRGTSDITFDVDFDSNNSSDKLNIIATDSAPTFSVNSIGAIATDGVSKDNGTITERTYTILDGQGSLSVGNGLTVDSGIYKYLVSATSDNKGVKLTANENSENSLYILNHLTSDERTFQFVGNSHEYYSKQDLKETLAGKETTSGTLNVIGRGKTTDTIIAQTSASDSTKHSMFEVVNANTTLNINDVTIKNATAASGSVINATATDSQINLSNVAMTNNTATKANGGGAIYNSGTLGIKGSTFTSNSTTNRSAKGGAINNTGTISEISNTEFNSNSAMSMGGTIYNSKTGTIKSITDSTFKENESVQQNGGAIFNSGTIESISNTKFISNKATQKCGGAITNSGKIETITGATFDSSSATIGGAISNSGTIGITDTTFTQNIAKSAGGAVHNTGSMSISNSKFEKNQASSNNGAAIWNIGTMTVTDTTFSDNTGNDYIYNKTNGNMSIIADTINNYELNNGTTATITNISTGTHSLSLIAKNNNTFTVRDKINGGDSIGNLNTQGNVILDNIVTKQNITVDSGTLSIGESTVNTGTYLVNSNLNIGSNTANLNNKSVEGGKIVVGNDGNFNITNPDDITISASMSGAGTSTKTGSGTLTLTGADNSNYSGIFNVNEGTLNKATSATFFGKDAKVNIANGTKVIYNAGLNETFSNDTLADIIFAETGNGTFSVVGQTGGNYTVANDWYTSNGSNSLNFTNGTYTLSSILGNSTSTDTVTFNNATVKHGASASAAEKANYDMGHNTFVVENGSTLDFYNRVAGDDYKFEKLTANGTQDITIDVNLDIVKEEGTITKKAYGDTITTTDSSSKGVFNIKKLFITSDNGVMAGSDNNLTKGKIQVFKNADNKAGLQVADVNNTQVLCWATNVYKYVIKSAETEYTADSIEITPDGPSSTDTLRDLNRYQLNANGGNRGFNFVITDTDGTNTYKIYRDLDTTSAGSFAVLGANSATKSILSGERSDLVVPKEEIGTTFGSGARLVLSDGKYYYYSDAYDVNSTDMSKVKEVTVTIDTTSGDATITKDQFGTDEKASMFELVNATDLEIDNISIENAYRYSSDTIKNGSAIYANNEKATVKLENVDFKYNGVENGNGGAISNENSASFTIHNAVFSGNTASGDRTVGYGGAIYTKAGLSLDNVTFTNNSANFGGAIFNDGTADGLNITGTFTGNHSTINAGAVYNQGNIATLDGTYTGNYSALGGAIYNGSNHNIDKLSGIYTDNYATGASGGAIYNSGSATITTIENATFSGNSTKTLSQGGTGGGAIYNAGTIDNIVNTKFENNSAKEGGAIYNLGTVKITDSTFRGNNGQEAGGAYTSYLLNNGTMSIVASSDDLTINNNTNSYIANNANSGKGLALIAESGKTLTIQDEIKGVTATGDLGIYGNVNLQDTVTNQNITVNSGTDDYLAGNLTVGVKGDSVKTYLQDSNLTINSGAVANLENANTNGGTITVNENGILNVNDTADTYIKSVITGSGVANKNGNGTLDLQGADSGFTGTLNIKEGIVAFTKTDSTSYISGNTVISDGAALNYTSDTNETLTKVSTTGTAGVLNKAGTGILTFNAADNSEFSGVANINGGTLKTQGVKTDDFDFNVNINNASTFDYTAAEGAKLTIGSDTSKVKFGDNASGATASFTGGDYTLSGEMPNASGNNIIIQGTSSSPSNVVLASDTYSNGNYTIKNAIIDLTNDKTETKTFGNLTVDSSTQLKIDLAFDTSTNPMIADKLIANNGGGVITLTSINISNLGDNGLNNPSPYVATVLSDNMSFSNSSLDKWSSDVYEYDVVADGQQVKLTAFKAADENSLKKMNNYTGKDGAGNATRGFQFTSNDNNPYEIGEDLGKTESGIFTVNGVDGGSTVISGKDNYSFFEVTDKDNSTQLDINNVEITKANGESGSAIYSDSEKGKITLNNVKVTDSTSTGNGGAINNTSSESFTINNGSFTGNKSGGNGGAIYTKDSMNITDTNFSGNTDKNGKNDIYLDGENAVVNYTAKNDSNISSGIAGDGTFNKNGNGTLNLSGKNDNFTGNLNVNTGDVIYSQTDATDTYISGKTNIADGSNVTLNVDKADIAAGTFSGNGTLNKEGSKDVAISGDNSGLTGDVNINAGSITFNSDTDDDKYFSGLTNIGENGSLIVNANKDTDITNFQGNGTLQKGGTKTLIIMGDNSNFTGNLDVTGGTLSMATGSKLGSMASGTFADGTTFNLQNTSVVKQADGTYTTNPNPPSIEDLYFATLNLKGNTKLNIDVDLKNTQADKIGAGTVTGGGHFVLGKDSLNVVSDSLLKNTSVQIAYGALADGDNIILSDAAKTVMGPIQKYDVTYGGGNLGFSRQGGSTPNINQVNPAVMASSVATQLGGYLTQLQTMQDSFFHMDRYTKYPHMMRLTAENINRNALVEHPIYQTSPVPEVSQAMWVKPYTSFEKVNLKGGIGVSNETYGMLYGGDSNLVDLRHGYKGVMSAFIGYNGAHMSYNGVSMNQQGGTLGVTGTLYKGNFFTGLTLSSGASAGEAYTQYGRDNFAMLTAGVASKTGYNWELNNGKVIVQPTLFLGYSFVNTFDYTNAAGVRMDSDPLNVITINPSVKVIGNTKSGWQPYAAVDMVWSIMDNTKVMANDVRLPQLSVKPYVQYGVGIQKTWADRFTGFFQTMIRNGGRNGIVLTAGFRWALGKDSSPKTKVDSSTSTAPKKRTVIKSL